MAQVLVCSLILPLILFICQLPVTATMSRDSAAVTQPGFDPWARTRLWQLALEEFSFSRQLQTLIERLERDPSEKFLQVTSG